MKNLKEELYIKMNELNTEVWRELSKNTKKIDKEIYKKEVLSKSLKLVDELNRGQHEAITPENIRNLGYIITPKSRGYTFDYYILSENYIRIFISLEKDSKDFTIKEKIYEPHINQEIELEQYCRKHKIEYEGREIDEIVNEILEKDPFYKIFTLFIQNYEFVSYNDMNSQLESILHLIESTILERENQAM